MAEGKWITGLNADMPALDAATHVLKARLEAVQHFLPQARTQAHADVEHVHQLRVSTRRAGAAVRIFAKLLPPKAERKIRVSLKRIRRAAGEARDWDVFLQALVRRAEETEGSHHPGLDLLSGIAHGRRMDAQEHLVENTNDIELEPLIGQTIESIRRPKGMTASTTLCNIAATQLHELLQEFQTAASDDLSSYEHLHRVRVIGKRLRYAMEVFESCFGPEFRETYYAAVEEMQDTLGLANDSFVAVGRLERIEAWVRTTQPTTWERFHPGIEGLLTFHRKRLPKQREEFLHWLPQWQAKAETLIAQLKGMRRVVSKRHAARMG